MTMLTRRAALSATSFALPAVARAQGAWPNRPVRIVIGFAAGGSMDAIGRSMGRYLEREFGQPFVVENRSGAGGRIATAAVARAPGDGYTLLLTSSAAHGVAPALYSDLQYHPMNDFTHIGLVCTGPMFLLANVDAPYRDLAGLVATVKARGTPANFGSGGIGSLGHLSGEMARGILGIPMQHVSYRGSAPAQIDLIAGQLELISDNMSSHGAQVNAGRMRALAVASRTRMAEFPDVPTWTEQGYPQMVANAWYALTGSAGIPADIAAKLNAGLAGWLAASEAKDLLRGMVMTPEGRMSPTEFTAFVDSEVKRWGEVARSANIRVES